MDGQTSSVVLLILLGIMIVFATTEGTVDSSPDTALRFAHCLVDTISESLLFSDKDHEDMTTVIEVMTIALRAIDPDNRSGLPVRIMTTAFATSMADIVAVEDPILNLQRIAIYNLCLEDCSMTATGSIDTEYISEAMRLIGSIESSRLASINGYQPGLQQASSASQVSTGESEFQTAVPQQLVRDYGETSSDPNSGNVSQSRENPIVSTLPAVINQPNDDITENPFNPNLRTIIQNILMGSSTFFNLFQPGVNRQVLARLARVAVEFSLANYSSDVIEEASNSVENEISALTSESGFTDYAAAISKAIASTLQTHGLDFTANGVRLANDIISNLDENASTETPTETINGSNSSAPESYEQDEYIITPSPSISVPPETGREQFINYQTSTNYGFPVSNPPEFIVTLIRFISNSSIINRIFCSNFQPAYIQNLVFRMVMSSLFDMDPQASSRAATLARNSFNQLPSQFICQEYANILSQTIINALQSAGILNERNVSIVVNRMISAINEASAFGVGQMPMYSGDQQTFPLTRTFPTLEPSFFNGRLPSTGLPGQQLQNLQAVREMPSIPGAPVSRYNNISNILRNIFKSSNNFMNIFGPNATEEEIVYFSSLLARSALFGYPPNVSNEALANIENSLNSMPAPYSGERYANVLSRGIVSALDSYGLLNSVNLETMTENIRYVLDGKMQSYVAQRITSGDERFQSEFNSTVINAAEQPVSVEPTIFETQKATSFISSTDAAQFPSSEVSEQVVPQDSGQFIQNENVSPSTVFSEAQPSLEAPYTEGIIPLETMQKNPAIPNFSTDQSSFSLPESLPIDERSMAPAYSETAHLQSAPKPITLTNTQPIIVLGNDNPLTEKDVATSLRETNPFATTAEGNSQSLDMTATQVSEKYPLAGLQEPNPDSGNSSNGKDSYTMTQPQSIRVKSRPGITIYSSQSTNSVRKSQPHEDGPTASNSPKQENFAIISDPTSRFENSPASVCLPYRPNPLFMDQIKPEPGDYDFDEHTSLFARRILDITSASIASMLSQNFNLIELCGRLNEFAVILNIPFIRFCSYEDLTYYLLNVLQSATSVLSA